MKHILILLVWLSATGISKSQNWTSIGPNKLPKGHPMDQCAWSAGNGAFFTLAVEPTRPMNVMTCGNASGIRRSLAGSTQWEAKNDAIPTIANLASGLYFLRVNDKLLKLVKKGEKE